MARFRLSLFDQFLQRNHLDNDYSLKSRLEFIVKGSRPLTYILDTSRDLRNEDDFALLLRGRSRYAEFDRIFEPLLSLRVGDFLIQGILPAVDVKPYVNRIGPNEIKGHLVRKEILANFVNDGEFREFTYSEIKRYITDRALQSVLFESVDQGARLLVLFGYTHNISIDGVAPVVQDNGLLVRDVAIRKRLLFRKAQVQLCSLDVRNYIVADDYTPNVVAVESTFIPAAFFGMMCIKVRDFVSNLNVHLKNIVTLTKRKFAFVSCFD